jgi:hypothetical protein
VPDVVVGFWNCTLSTDWSTLTMEQRITKMRAASFSVDIEGRMQSKAGLEPIQTIFVAPEYAFSKECPANQAINLRKPAFQTDAAGFEQLLTAVKEETRKRPYMLMVPGTIAHSKNEEAMNTCIAVLGGRVRSVFHKKEGVGEVQEGDGLAFKPGTGSGLMTESGKTFLLQICKDATVAADAGAPTFDVQIVVGQGVGEAAIARRGTHLLIVADAGNYGVIDLRTNRKLLFYRKDKVLDCDIYFYRAVI